MRKVSFNETYFDLDSTSGVGSIKSQYQLRC